jgi:hypothetical protein
MKKVTGRFLPLSIPRRIIGDMLYAAQQLTLLPGEGRMHLAEVVAARAAAKPRPSWLAMFIKAFATVAARHPEYRRVFVSRPWYRLYQYDQNVVSVVVEREWQGEPALFLARLHSPEKMSLTEIDAQLRRFKNTPVEEISGFVGALRLARLPFPLRRLLWKIVMHWMPGLRAKFLGTMGTSLTAGMGVTALTLLTPWSLTFFYDMFQDDGSLTVRAMFDHRVFDGRILARGMKEVERELRGPIRQELLALGRAVA